MEGGQGELVFLVLRGIRVWFGLLPCDPAWVGFTRPAIPALELNADLVSRSQIAAPSSSQMSLTFSGAWGLQGPWLWKILRETRFL